MLTVPLADAKLQVSVPPGVLVDGLAGNDGQLAAAGVTMATN